MLSFFFYCSVTTNPDTNLILFRKKFKDCLVFRGFEMLSDQSTKPTRPIRWHCCILYSLVSGQSNNRRNTRLQNNALPHLEPSWSVQIGPSHNLCGKDSMQNSSCPELGRIFCSGLHIFNAGSRQLRAVLRPW